MEPHSISSPRSSPVSPNLSRLRFHPRLRASVLSGVCGRQAQSIPSSLSGHFVGAPAAALFPAPRTTRISEIPSFRVALMLISGTLFIVLDRPCSLCCAPARLKRLRGASKLVKPVCANTSFHVLAPKPDRATASKRGVPRREDDLFVSTHAKNFVRKDQGSCG